MGYLSVRDILLVMRAVVCGLGLLLLQFAAGAGPDIIWQFGGLRRVSNGVFSPNQSIIAAGGWDKTVKIYDAQIGALLHTLSGHTYIVSEVRFSPNGQMLASASHDFKLILWRTSDWHQALSIEHPYDVNSVAWSPDGTKVATACQDSIVRVFRTSDGALLRTFPFSLPKKVVFSPNGNMLAVSSGGTPGLIRIWDPMSGVLLRTILPNASYLSDIAFSPDSLTLASANGQTNIVQLWSTSTGSLIGQLTGHTGPVWSVKYSPDGTVLASGSGGSEQAVKLWAMPAGTLLRTLPMHPGRVDAIEFSQDSSTLLTSSSDLRKWRVSDGTLLAVIGANSEVAPSISYSPSNMYVATPISYTNPRIALFDSANGQFQRDLPGNRFTVRFTPDGQLYASTTSGPNVQIRKFTNGSVYLTLIGHTENVFSVDFSSNGQFVATSGGYYQNHKGHEVIRDCNARLWRLSDGALLRTFTGHNRIVFSVAISPNVEKLATCGEDGVKLWDINNDRLLGSFAGEYKKIAFSPDGKYFAAAHLLNADIDLFDSRNSAFIRTFTGLTERLDNFAFSPTGNVIAAGDTSNPFPTIRIWRVSDGSTVRVFDEEVGTGVLGIAFSSDGQTFAYTRDDASVVMARNPFAPISVFPASFSVSPGLVISGGLPALFLSDDDRLDIRPGVILSSSMPPIRLVVEGVSPIIPVGELRFGVESQANVTNIAQTIDVYDFKAAEYVRIDSRSLQLEDSTAVVTVENPGRFFESGTRRLRARVSWKAQGTVLTYPWTVGIDQATWIVTP